jgi:transcriptional regulator NrdR family protein
MGKKVIKRDGSIEDFLPEKIARVVKAAGLEPKKARALVNTLNDWAVASPKEEISSLEIRDKVLTELKKTDTSVANLFAWYQKTKDKS